MISLDPRSEDSGAPRLLSEINVTPFIDVMLVLLVIFMVIAPLLIVGIPLKLPKVTAPAIAQVHKPVIVSMNKDGNLFIGDDEVAVEAMPRRVAALIKDDPQQVVYVRADRGIDYGRVMDLLGKIGAAGVARVSLVAEGQQPQAAKP